VPRSLVSNANNQQKADFAAPVFLAGFLLDPEDKGNTSPRKVGRILTASLLHPGR
jgi:hypothetical protein